MWPFRKSVLGRGRRRKPKNEASTSRRVERGQISKPTDPLSAGLDGLWSRVPKRRLDPIERAESLQFANLHVAEMRWQGASQDPFSATYSGLDISTEFCPPELSRIQETEFWPHELPRIEQEPEFLPDGLEAIPGDPNWLSRLSREKYSKYSVHSDVIDQRSNLHLLGGHEMHGLETEATAQIGLLRPTNVLLDKRICPLSLFAPSFASGWDETISELRMHQNRIVYLYSQVEFYTEVERLSWIVLRKMSQLYLQDRTADSVHGHTLDPEWLAEYRYLTFQLGFSYIGRKVRNRLEFLLCSGQASSRSRHLCLLYTAVKEIRVEAIASRLLHSQVKNESGPMEGAFARTRRENVLERADALRQVGRTEREEKQRYWHNTLMETPLRRREREARALTNKVLADLAAAWPRFLEEKITKISLETSILPFVNEPRFADTPPNVRQRYSSTMYSTLREDEFRLLEIKFDPATSSIETVLHIMPMHECPPYVAVSYTWGDPGRCRLISVNGEAVQVRENIWFFLSNLRYTTAIEERLFWIDALCIDQNNVRERNHQVKLMKEIYQQASNVVVWLGNEADGSNTAIDYLNNEKLASFKSAAVHRGQLWSINQGKAILAMCERVYWRRIWIIQEIIHARTITVFCGRKTFPWQALENTYNTLKAIESAGRQRHYRYAAQVLDSVACTMVWQRAHWRHPDTSAPAMVQLVRVFRDWQAGDIRDKVNALNGLVSPETSIVIEYQSSTQQVFEAVREAAIEWTAREDSLFREVLGIPYPHFRVDARRRDMLP